MNKILLAGLVVKAGEMRSVSDTQDVVNFTLLTTDSYTDKDGNQKENTQFHNCSVFTAKGKAVKLTERLNKGRVLELEGKLKTGQKRTGKTREGVEKQFVNKGIVVQEITKWGSKGTEKAAAEATAAA
jgi:single-strand DNA-binding protein